MKVLVLYPDELPDNANPLVNYYPTSPAFAGRFIDNIANSRNQKN